MLITRCRIWRLHVNARKQSMDMGAALSASSQ